MRAAPGVFISCVCPYLASNTREGNGNPLQYSCLANPMDRGAWWAVVHGVTRSRTWLSDFSFTFHFHALEKEMATHSNVLSWRIPGTGVPGGLPSMGSHRVWHYWSDLAAASNMGFLGGSDSKKINLQCRRPGFHPLMGKISWRREWQPTPVFFLPGEFFRQRSLVGYSPWGRKESETTEQLIHTHIHTLSNNSSNIVQVFLLQPWFHGGFCNSLFLPVCVPSLGAVICSLTSHFLHVYKEVLISQFVQIWSVVRLEWWLLSSL